MWLCNLMKPMKCPCSNILLKEKIHLTCVQRHMIANPKATILLQGNGCLTTKTKAAL